MYSLAYDITIGDFKVGMLDKVEVHKSVELLADTATIVLPGAEYNAALDVESKIKRGDRVSVKFGYAEEGLVEEFSGYLQRISTDDGNITLECEDDLFLFRKDIPDTVLKNIAINDLLEYLIKQCGLGYSIANTYEWKYEKFVINTATGYDVLKKVQEECGADIYLKDNTLHIHAPGERTGDTVYYDFSANVEKCDLTYRTADDRKVLVVVKALQSDGSVKELEWGATGGDKIEVRCPTSDYASMRQRGEAEIKRHSYDGYEGNITTWLIPRCEPGDTADLHDADYQYKDGRYFVNSVTTEFSKDGGKRTVEIGFRLS